MSDPGRMRHAVPAPSPAPRLLAAATLPLALSAAAVFSPALGAVALAADLAIAFAAIAEAVIGLTRRVPVFEAITPGVVVPSSSAQLLLYAENPDSRPLSLEVDLDLSYRLAGGPPARVDIPPGSRAELRLDLAPRRRGPGAIEAIRWSCAGPLGLLRFSGVEPLGMTVLVRPSAAPRQSRGQIAAARTAGGLSPSSRPGRGGDFYALRDYAPGEDAGAIDWKASTRVGRPVSRIGLEEGSASVIVAVDCGRLMRAEKEGRSALDEAADATLRLADAAIRRGDRFRAISFDGRVRGELPELGGPASLRLAAAFAAGLESSAEDPDYVAVAARLRRSLTKRSLVVIVTEIAETAPLSSLERAVKSLAGRHAVTLVLLRDEALAASSRGPASYSSAAAAFRTAAAAEMLAERDAAKARLARFGARVLDVTPERLPSRMVEAYLEAKRDRRI